MKKCLCFFAAGLLTVFTLNTHAGGILSVGLDYLAMNAKISGLGEAEPTAVQLRVSTGLTPIVDIEGVLAIGVGDDEFSNASGNTLDLTTLKGVYAIAGFDAIPLLNIYGKAGVLNYEFENNTGDKFDDSGLAYGLGVAIDLPALGTIIVEQNFYPDIEKTGFKIETSVFSIGYHMGL